MEWFVTSPHCDTQSEDTVGINPYTLLCPAATLQATSRRIGREHRTQCARVSRFAPQPCHQLSAILTISPPEPPNTLDQLFLTERPHGKGKSLPLPSGSRKLAAKARSSARLGEGAIQAVGQVPQWGAVECLCHRRPD